MDGLFVTIAASCLTSILTTLVLLALIGHRHRGYPKRHSVREL